MAKALLFFVRDPAQDEGCCRPRSGGRGQAGWHLGPGKVGAHLAARGQVAVIGKSEGLAESNVVFSALIR